jgi:hypothetical protein
MTEPRAGAEVSRRAGGGAKRAVRFWRVLPHERRLAAGAALGLFMTLFLPWYQDTVIASGTTSAAALRAASASITGWGAFSFVEAAVLLVAAGVIVLLFVRAEGGAFHVPGGDGGVISAAGLWTCLLIVWRIFDKAGGQSDHAQYVTSTGIEWGIFIALGVAGLLVYAGSRIRQAHEPEPPLPGERPSSRSGGGRPPAPAGAGKRRPSTPRPVAAEPRAGQHEDWDVEGPVRPQEAPTRRQSPDQPRSNPPRAKGEPAGRGRRFPELDEIELDDPPTARLGRPRPIIQPAPDPDDQLTIPIDRPE